MKGTQAGIGPIWVGTAKTGATRRAELEAEATKRREEKKAWQADEKQFKRYVRRAVA